VLSLDPTSYDKAWTLLGIERATRDSDYLASIVSVPAPTRRTLAIAVARLRGLGVDGILVVAPQQDAIETLAELSGDIPLVAVASGPQQVLSAVAIDHYAGAVAATRHLLDLGHRGARRPDQPRAPLRRVAGHAARGRRRYPPADDRRLESGRRL